MGLRRTDVQQRRYGMLHSLLLGEGFQMLIQRNADREHLLNVVVHQPGELQQRGGGVDCDTHGESERRDEHLHGVQDSAAETRLTKVSYAGGTCHPFPLFCTHM